MHRFFVTFLVGSLLFFVAQPLAAKEEQRVLYFPDKKLRARIMVLVQSDGTEIRHGKFQGFHKTGWLAVQGRYHEGKPTGIWHWWDDQGNLLRKSRFDGPFEEMLSGRSRLKPEVTFRDNMTGVPVAEGQLKYNKAHGKWTYWHNDGSVKASGKYVEGRPDGRWVRYFRSGQVEALMDYHLGLLHGRYVQGFPDGQEKARGKMEHGLREGTWEYFYPNGQLKMEGAFKQDQESGPWKYYDDLGHLEKTLIYRRGLLIREVYPPQKPRSIVVIPNAENLLGAPQLYDEQGKEIYYRAH